MSKELEDDIFRVLTLSVGHRESKVRMLERLRELGYPESAGAVLEMAIERLREEMGDAETTASALARCVETKPSLLVSPLGPDTTLDDAANVIVTEGLLGPLAR